MSGVAIARYLLKSNAALTAQVPAARIVAGNVKLGSSLPAIGIRTISSNKRHNVAQDGSAALWTERVQVTVIAGTFPVKKTILNLVRAALPKTRGTVNGFDCDSILTDIEGPDLDDEEAGIYEQAQDFIVKFNR